MPDSGRASRRGEVLTALAIALIAIVPRIAVLSSPPTAAPIYDMAEYWDRAVFMMEHGRLYENSTRMPGYPAALAVALTVVGAGPSLDAARRFNAFAGGVAAMLTYWLARRTAGRPASFAAAMVVAWYPSFLIYTTFTATEAVVTVPLLGALVAATYRSRRAAVACGVCTALTALVRPAGIAMLPAAVVAVAMDGWRPARSALVRVVLLAVAFAAVMLPWWVHNLRVHDRFVPLDASGGINMAIGNNPHASGTYRYREASYLYTLNLAPVEVATPDTSAQATRYAIRYIQEHPGQFIRLIPAKLGALFAIEGRELAHIYSLGFFGQRTAPTVMLWAYAVVFAFPALLIAALGGLAVRGGVSRRVLLPASIWIAATIAMHALSFGDPRYHLPMVPVLAVLATALADRTEGFSRARLAIAVVIVSVLAVVWWFQSRVYWNALETLTAPGGWQSHISYDDLL